MLHASEISPRLLRVRFDGTRAELWSALYRSGRPVQYAYEPEPLPLARVQTPYAARPWASEMPSAGRPLRLELLARLRARGVGLTWLTHAAGLSSTGDATLACQKATKTIPLVTTATASPHFFAASLARPGGNITGLATQFTETQRKRFQLLREVLPGLTRVASLSNPEVNSPATLKDFEDLMHLRDLDTREERFARVKVPEGLPRFVEVGSNGLLIPLEKVIAHHLGWLFPEREIVEQAAFRVTRDGDTDATGPIC